MSSETLATTPFESSFGSFTLHALRDTEGTDHAALVRGDPGAEEAPLVRVQSSCLTGTAFRAELCDCRQQLELGLRMIAERDSGILIYLDQEGRGHGLVEKVAQLALIAGGLDTVDAARAREVAEDLRHYAVVKHLLGHLLGRPGPIRLATNNPAKRRGIVESGVTVVEVVPIEPDPTPDNSGYLRVKRDRMGHLLSKV